MVNFSVDELREMMGYPHNIRNMSVIAHVDHGKSTLTDSLIGAAGIIAQAKAGDARFMDTRKDEQERTITIKSTGVSLFFAIENSKLDPLHDAAKQVKAFKDAGKDYPLTEKNEAGEQLTTPYLINLIDSPGHVDFSSEVTAALRITDGALVVVDCVEGVCVQTETVLRQAIAERIKPVLWINKMDRCFLELQMAPEEAYQNFNRAVESVNVVIATYNDDLLGDVQVYPEKGTVGFGSGYMAWGFTIRKFGLMYSAKFGVSIEKMMDKLWGNNFFSPKLKKWSVQEYGSDGKKWPRAFCLFIMQPIDSLHVAIMGEKKDVYNKMLEKLGVTIPKDAKDLLGKPLLKRVMQAWLPAQEALLEMIINHLPSPVKAQGYRVSNLYSGPMDDESATAIRNCDPDGPLMMYVSKMVPTSEKGRFYAFGRVYSGIIKSGQEVRIYGPEYEPGKKKDLFIKKIQRTVLMMGRFVEQLPDCPCGNLIGLVGVDNYLLKSGTVCTHAEAFPFMQMKYSVSPVVRCAVDVKNASDLPKLMEGLKRLAKSDPLVLCYTAPSGEHIIAGAGELHLEICLKDLKEDFMKGAPIKQGDPVVSFCETLTAKTKIGDTEGKPNIAKSPNKHNRIYMTAEPLTEEFGDAIEDSSLFGPKCKLENKVQQRNMIDKFGMHPDEAKKLWTYGCPPDAVSNILVDATKAVQYLNEVKDSMVGGFIQATAAGIICEESMRNSRFNLVDMTMHADAIHRGAGQIMPPCKRAMYACQLTSGARLLEPMYVCDITVPNSACSGVYQCLNARRSTVEEKEDRIGTPLCKIKAFVPVLESFGFTGHLRQLTSGQAFPQLSFSHWQILEGDPLEEGSQANKIVMGVRQRKGLKAELPEWGNYYDKM